MVWFGLLLAQCGSADPLFFRGFSGCETTIGIARHWRWLNGGGLNGGGALRAIRGEEFGVWLSIAETRLEAGADLITSRNAHQQQAHRAPADHLRERPTCRAWGSLVGSGE